MKHGKYDTLFVAAIILIYSLFGKGLLVTIAGKWHSYVIEPLFWIVMFLLAYYMRGKTMRGKKRVKSSVMFWTCGAAGIYLAMYFVSGLFGSFGYNALDTSALGILVNLLTVLLPLILRECVRACLVYGQPSNRSSTRLTFAVTAVVFAFVEYNPTALFTTNMSTPLAILEQVGGNLVPALVTSLFLTYVAYLGGFLPGVIFVSAITLPAIILPIIPNIKWLALTLLRVLIPFVAYLLIEYDVGLIRKTVSRKDIRKDSPGKWVPIFIFAIVLMLFVVGMLPWQPVSIATGSMLPEIKVGDMVVVNKLDKDTLEVGDVIQYSKDNYYVIHRIVEIREENGVVTYITKGDNNNAPDTKPVYADQVVGKVIFRIPYIGWLTLWMNSQTVDQTGQNVEVETGGTY